MAILIHELLQESAAKYPNNVAVRFKGDSLKYKDLNFLSDHLAASLINHGSQAKGRIGLYMEKTPHAVAAIFGILKSGSCYVPLDPTGPIDRHAAIINDCGLEHLIVDKTKIAKLRQILEQTRSLKYVYAIDADEKELTQKLESIKMVDAKDITAAEADIAAQTADLDAEDLGYILYTSGSTGQPKGVTISHRASLAFVNWAQETFTIGPEDTVSSHAPLHFDLSVLDIFATIKAGATICIVPPGLSWFPTSLAEFIDIEGITVWYSVPMVLTQLIQHGKLQDRDLSKIRVVLFAGEVFPTSYLRQIMSMLPNAEFYNLYGPTETNVCTYYAATEIPETDAPIPIGVLCCEDQAVILDDHQSPVDCGEIGELYVSGPTLMSGYWNDENKTENSIFELSVCGKTQRAYRTGDLVRLLEDGNIAYHGRADHMIKSRGYRIELGEIESVLTSHDNICEAVAWGVPDEKIGKRIACAIVLNESADLSEIEIKLFCSKRLPKYMIPDIIRFLNAMPRTSTNKIDRKQLERESA
jgi:amino acid adenylation domain-containing protein